MLFCVSRIACLCGHDECAVPMIVMEFVLLFAYFWKACFSALYRIGNGCFGLYFPHDNVVLRHMLRTCEIELLASCPADQNVFARVCTILECNHVLMHHVGAAGKISRAKFGTWYGLPQERCFFLLIFIGVKNNHSGVGAHWHV
jgi:hypothetical protein